MDASRVLFAALLGLLVSCLIGYEAFPVGDDFAYGPLTEHRINPKLYVNDDQLRLFENHAYVYEWMYRAGRATVGVEPAFRLALWLLAVITTVAIWAMLRALEAPLAILPMVLGISVVVQLDGMGRGDFGGLTSPFFHHHNVALTLVIAAVAAAFFRKIWLAGILLGLAAYAQPMTAFHGAIVIGLGSLIRNPLDAVKLAVAAGVVAFPVAVWLFGAILNAPDSDVMIDLIADAYRFRAPAHYDPPWFDIMIATLYLMAGCAGVALLYRKKPDLARFAAGLLLGFTLLHLVTLVVYKLAIAEWVGFFILDANRSTPVLFTVGTSLAFAGMWFVKTGRGVWLTGILLATILLLNMKLAGIVLFAIGVAMMMAGDVPRTRAVVLCGLGAALLILFPAKPRPPYLPESTLLALAQIRTETPVDALFVIPVSLMEFRQYAQRSAYVDFKMFSVAQPDQASLTRARIEEVTRPAPEHRAMQGWGAAYLWDEEQNRQATCANMAEILATTGAQYILRRVFPDEPAPECPELPRPIMTETLAIYGSVE
ncbi:hypothetical protein RUE5091_03894 [Ruegeria denitrificans]|uniref:DUF6798 domain-containing protein n=1 Tax=Ruegeria denitrificans TaxID=1715692 RepID=A0A0P1IZF5_9RHOB|nr:DUF6798 domain-containing protein [Ruegeria denitrificans]CUK15623.1 hypothetical protein RUE5091_03894 [Ruegeria denitrificans]